MSKRSVNPSRTPRLFVAGPLDDGAAVALEQGQAHYLQNVLRLKNGAAVTLFNGSDGEWQAEIVGVTKRGLTLRCDVKLRDPSSLPDIDYLFSPLKHARLDYLAQKATELGAATLQPVIMGRTVAERINIERIRANVVEAAEQCNLVSVPEIREPVRFDVLMERWDPARQLIFCDEGAAAENPLPVLEAIPRGPLAVLVGPEGGFTAEERTMLRASSFVHRISLGPRIMRADTAAVAALTLVQAVLGDWR